MRVTIHQPDFLPWLGFFDRYSRSDLYIVLDDVQFIRRGWHHRDKIKTSGGSRWLTVPVLKKGNYHQYIKDVKIDYSVDWTRQHLNTLKNNYGKSPNFAILIENVASIYDKKYPFLIDLNLNLISFVAELLAIDTPIRLSSDFHVTSSASERLLELVLAAGGSHYITGTGSRSYLDEKLFKSNNIDVIWQNYNHPVYYQHYGNFVPNLSVIDYLMMRTSPGGLPKACSQ